MISNFLHWLVMQGDTVILKNIIHFILALWDLLLERAI